MEATIRYEQAGETVGTLELPIRNQTLELKAGDVPAGLTHLAVHLDAFTAQAGEDGFFLVPNTRHLGCSALTYFRERPDTEAVFRSQVMPVYAAKHGATAILAVVEGMPFEYELVAGVRGGRYYLYPRFLLDGKQPFEDIVIRFLPVEGTEADWCGLARRYRRYQLERGACEPLRERCQRYPVLAEAAQGPEVRIRLGWKPSPTTVPEQTEETEPPMHVAVTFDRAGDIVEEFHRQGIDQAEFCLVGWNRSGHDGCFPDLFPVEPKLGGEEALLRLTRKARDYGYLISCHTAPTSGYTLARRFDRSHLMMDRNGNWDHGGYTVGGLCGGRPYRYCPKEAYEKLAVQDFKDMARLGFRGIHYQDVLSIVRPVACHNPLHPLTSTEAGEWRRRTLELGRETFGGSSSEGAWDFCVKSLDYVLYTLFRLQEELPGICDQRIPFWQIVYHGIVLYNSFCATVNAAIKSDPALSLLNLGFGGRPLLYYYSRFKGEGKDWMGMEDLTCATDDELRAGVRRIKAEYERYKTVRDLQFEFLEEYEELADNVTRTRYGNGTVLVVNRSATPFTWNGRAVPPMSFVRIDPVLETTP